MIKTNLKKDNAITIIALVVTVIILLILSGVAISMITGKNGILNQTGNAKVETDAKSTEEQVELAIMIASTAGNGDINSEKGIDTLNKEIQKIDNEVKPITKEDLPIEDIEINKEHFAISEDGEVKRLEWYYTEDRTQITNGDQTLTLGDTVKYNPIQGLTADANGVYKKYESPAEKNGASEQIFKLESTADSLVWVVLGTDKEGNVLLVPSTNVGMITLQGQNGYQYGIYELHQVAEIYGHGKGAKSAKSITLEDINKLTGYNPEVGEKDETTGEWKKWGEGLIYEYGNKVTFTWNETTLGKVDYTATNGITPGTLSQSHSSKGFNWYDVVTKTCKVNTTYTGQITTLKSTSYSYNLKIDNCKTEKLCNALKTSNNSAEYYLLGFSCISANTSKISFGLYGVGGVMIGTLTLYDSRGSSYSRTYGVRPVVSLKSDIVFGGNEVDGWTIN